MYCENCGTKLNENAVFCKFCGRPVNQAVLQSEPEPLPVREEMVKEPKPLVPCQQTPSAPSAQEIALPAAKKKAKSIRGFCMLPLFLALGVFLYQIVTYPIEFYYWYGAGIEYLPYALSANIPYFLGYILLDSILPLILWHMYCKKSNRKAFAAMGVLALSVLVLQFLSACANYISNNLYVMALCNLIPGSDLFSDSNFRLSCMSSLVYYLPTAAVALLAFLARAGLSRAECDKSTLPFEEAEFAPETVPNDTGEWNAPLPEFDYDLDLGAEETTFLNETETQIPTQMPESAQVPTQIPTQTPTQVHSRFCGNCGAELWDDDLFCYRCGKQCKK